MTETNTQEAVEKRTPFIALVSFEIPQGGTTQIFARDLEHAKALLGEAHKNMRNFTIIDIFPQDQLADKLEVVEDDEDEDKVVH